MLIAVGRQLTIVVTVILVVGISTIFWPLESDRPERLLSAAGAKLCFAHDETLLVGATLEGEHVGDDLALVAAGVPSLLRLSLAETRVTRRGIESLQSLPKLNSLNLSRTRWTAEALPAITRLPALRELRLDECEWLTDAHLRQIASIPNLESLSLSKCLITNAGLDSLQNLTNLRSLCLEECPNIDDESFETIVRLCQQRRMNLNLSGTEVSRDGIQRLRHALPECLVYLRPESMVGLREIGERGQFITNQYGDIWGFRRRTDIDGNVYSLQPGDLTIVGTVKDLIDLNLENSNINDSMLMELGALPRLETLRLSSTHLTDAGLSILDRFPNLKSLWMMETGLNGSGLQHLAQVPNLVNLKVQAAQGDQILPYLEPLRNLQMLTICAPLTDADLEHLARLPKLRYLALIDTRVSAAGIAKLSASSTLSELRLDGGVMGDSDIDAIAAMRNLKWVVFVETQVTRTGRNRLAALRPDISFHWSGEMSVALPTR